MKQTTADKTAAIATLQTKLDDSGNHVASFDPTKSETQLMRITSGAIAGAAVAIPPAALSIPVSIAVGEGVSLATSSFSQTLGITDNKINAGGPSVSFSASQDVVATNPMTLSIPFGSTSLNLNDADSENIVVMYRWTTIENGETKFEAGILPGENVTRAKNKVSFQTTKFGTFQVGVAEKKITAPVVAKTEEPPALKSCERYAAELFPSCTTHGQVGCVTSNAFRSVDMNFLKGEFILSTPSIQNLQGNVILPLASRVRAGTQFGAAGNQFTGTFSLDSNNPAIKACERFTAAVYQPCAKDAQVGCVTTDAFKAADMTLIRPEIILAGRIIAGVTGTVVLPSQDRVVVGTTFGPAGVGIVGTSFADRPTLSYQGVTGTLGRIGQSMTVSPTTFSSNGSNITACNTQTDTPSLPNGLTINPSTCVISGTPTQLAPSRVYTLIASNAMGSSAAAEVNLGVLDTLTTPTFSVQSGAYGPAQTVTISTLNQGANIHYTTNGLDPTTASSVYSAALTVSSTTTIKAIAVKDHFHNSDVGVASYTINGAASTPTFSVAAGSYGPAQTVAISTATAGATIYYTTNGADPTTASTVYSTALTVSSTTTIKATAVRTGFSNSAIATGTYTINGSVATPTFSVAAGSYNSTQSVTISTATASASIYYTTNGTTPTTASTLYTGPVSVSSSTTLRAFAVRSGFSDSSVASAPYVIDTTPPSITLSSITTSNPGTTQTPTVRFTSNEAGTFWLFSDAGCSTNSISSNNTLIADSNLATTINLLANATTAIYVKAKDVLGNQSCTLIGSYTHDNTAPVAPVILDPSRSFNAPFNTAISQGVPADANFKEFRYTTTGIDPTCYTGSSSATQPTTVAIPAANTTLKVITCDLAGGASDVAAATYTYDVSPPNAPTVSGTTPNSNTRPTWTWTSINSGGNGTYRYKLNDNNLATGATEITDTSFTPISHLSEATHTLYVQERDAAGNWSSSGSFAIQVVIAPTAPSLSTPIRYLASLGISWGSVTGATSYNLYWSNVAGINTSSSKIMNVSSTYTHTSLTGSSTYYYKIAAVKSGIEGPLSNEVSAAPYSVAAPTISSITPTTGTVYGGTTVTITGTGFASGADVTIGGITISGGALTTSGSTTSITFITPTSNAPGKAEIELRNPDGQSAVSNTKFNYLLPIEILVVGGGGGGGSNLGGGGGAGGYRTATDYPVSTGSNLTITVGAGGSGGTGGMSQDGAPGISGGNSVFANITGAGGGGGAGAATTGTYSARAGSSGGSGGGGAYNASGYIGNSPAINPSQGNNGGNGVGYNAGAGGGGAGGPGGDGGSNGGNGGSGKSSMITGINLLYAGGGGGGNYQNTPGTGGSGGGGNGGTSAAGAAGAAGTVNTGGGGGGGGSNWGAGGAGGSGVVIIAYPIRFPALSNISLGLSYTVDTTTRPDYIVYRFTAGTGTISWPNPTLVTP